MSKDELKKLSKDELEDLGRENGLELDKRYTKGKLVKELNKHIESLDTEVEEVAVEEVAVSADPWGDLSIEEEAARDAVSVTSITKKRLLHSKGVQVYS
tara:strand:- start:2195 stop:2491 length:297 start_codon:yes stop_codon:yes gene_type:complete